jgi:two-component system osmolarity sensor histidine kinase EnvZ
MKPFERTQNRRSTDSAGTGLGLAISDALARKHGGKLAVFSAPGEGTRARLIMPTDGTAANQLV